MKLWFSRNKSNGDNATAAESEEVRPLVAVTRAIEGGATTVSAIVQQTGLQESTVSAPDISTEDLMLYVVDPAAGAPYPTMRVERAITQPRRGLLRVLLPSP